MCDPRCREGGAGTALWLEPTWRGRPPGQPVLSGRAGSMPRAAARGVGPGTAGSGTRLQEGGVRGFRRCWATRRGGLQVKVSRRGRLESAGLPGSRHQWRFPGSTRALVWACAQADSAWGTPGHHLHLCPGVDEYPCLGDLMEKSFPLP